MPTPLSFPSRTPSRRQSARKSGFTLVELLVVIGIIALLISILLPALNRARDQARKTQCLSNLRTQGQIMQMYLNQNKGALPVGTWGAYPEYGYVLWQQTFQIHIGEGMMMPAGLIPIDPVQDVNTGDGRMFYCPVQTNQGTGYNDPGNEWFGTPGAATRMSYTQRPEWRYENKSYVTHIWDSNKADGSHVRSPVYPKPWFPKPKDFKERALVMDMLVNPTHESFLQGHKTGCNVLYSDWSAKWVPYDNLQPMIRNLQGFGPARRRREPAPSSIRSGNRWTSSDRELPSRLTRINQADPARRLAGSVLVFTRIFRWKLQPQLYTIA